MVTRASPRVAVPRAFMRVAGSIAGAAVALVVLRLFVYQSLPLCVSLFALSCIGTFGFVTSRDGYAWVVGTVTACLIILMSLDQPQGAFTTAVNRVAEVTIGTMASLVVCSLSPAPREAGATPAASLLDPPPLAFWRRRYGAELARWLPGLEFFNLIVAPTANFAQWARTDTIDPNCCHAEDRSFDPDRSG